MAQAGQGGAHLADHLTAVHISPAVTDAIHGEQHLGFNLLETVQHRMGAHVGRTNAPDGPNADGRQKRNHGLGDVRQIGRHPVPGHHALRLQMQGQRCHLLAQFGPGQFPRRRAAQGLFVVADDGFETSGVGRVHMPEHLVRVVELRAGKPLGVDHPRRHIARIAPYCWLGQHRCMRGGGLQFKIIPNALPERVQIRGRPTPQGVVRIKRQTALVFEPGLVQLNLRKKRRGCVHWVGSSSCREPQG